MNNKQILMNKTPLDRETLNKLMQEAGIGTVELARMIGVSRQTVWNWRAGIHKIDPQKSMLIRFCLEVP